jgi:hypothetical protein
MNLNVGKPLPSLRRAVRRPKKKTKKILSIEGIKNTQSTPFNLRGLKIPKKK